LHSVWVRGGYLYTHYMSHTHVLKSGKTETQLKRGKPEKLSLFRADNHEYRFCCHAYPPGTLAFDKQKKSWFFGVCCISCHICGIQHYSKSTHFLNCYILLWYISGCIEHVLMSDICHTLILWQFQSIKASGKTEKA